MAAEAQLAATEAELEKQRMLNEKLENDLLQMEQRKPNGEAGSDSPQLGSLDGLAGIELGKKTVRSLCGHQIDFLNVGVCRTPQHGLRLYRLPNLRIPRFFPSSLVNATASDSETPSWKRYGLS